MMYGNGRVEREQAGKRIQTKKDFICYSEDLGSDPVDKGSP